MENRKYVVFECSEIYKVNYNEILETSPSTLRKSADETKTFVKYDGNMPKSISSLTTKSKEYTHSEILEVLKTDDFSDPTIM